MSSYIKCGDDPTYKPLEGRKGKYTMYLFFVFIKNLPNITFIVHSLVFVLFRE